MGGGAGFDGRSRQAVSPAWRSTRTTGARATTFWFFALMSDAESMQHHGQTPAMQEAMAAFGAAHGRSPPQMQMTDADRRHRAEYLSNPSMPPLAGGLALPG